MYINIIANCNSITNILKKDEKIFLIVFNEFFYIKYHLNKNYLIFYNKSNNSIILKLPLYVYKINKLNQNILNYNNVINLYFLDKIKFTGKSYKIKKKACIFFFFFNKSHVEFIFWKNFFFKKVKKNKIILKHISLKNIKYLKNFIIKIRPVNIFNKRGLRNKRSLIYKKVGKKTA